MPADGPRYRLRLTRPGAHLLEIHCELTEPDPGGQVLRMPAWIPGSYMIRDYARNVVSFSAADRAGAVAVAKLDKQTWRCAPCTAPPLRIVYEVYANDLSVRGAHFDTTHAYFNGAAVLVQAEGREHQPQRLAIEGPPAPGWTVATSLRPEQVDAHGFGGYLAGDYDELIDHPVEIGALRRIGFEACGVAHELVLSGTAHCDEARLAGDLARVCEQHIRLFGEPAPMDRYLFLATVLDEGYGGLEHRASSSLHVARKSLPAPGLGKPDEDYTGFLGLASHEYFHTWNVKRIKPARFTPLDLSREVHTTLLWAFEGITSYYDDLALLRAGLIERQAYLDLVARTLTRVQRGHGRLRQSLGESSFDAWTRFYKQDENAPNAIVSYYAKGALVALALDLTLRLETRGARSLDDLMRLLWTRHGLTGEGVAEDGVERAAAEIAGRPLQAFFDQAVREAGDLPLEGLLAEFGVRCEWRAAQSAQDRGGRFAGELRGERPGLGLRLRDEAGRAQIAQVFEGGAAQAAGLSAGDELLALDGLRISPANLDERLARLAPGRPVTAALFRRDELLQLELTPQPLARDTCALLPEDDPGAERQRRLDAWLAPP